MWTIKLPSFSVFILLPEVSFQRTWHEIGSPRIRLLWQGTDRVWWWVPQRTPTFPSACRRSSWRMARGGGSISATSPDATRSIPRAHISRRIEERIQVSLCLECDLRFCSESRTCDGCMQKADQFLEKNESKFVHRRLSLQCWIMRTWLTSIPCFADLAPLLESCVLSKFRTIKRKS